MCHYQLEDHTKALDALRPYLQAHPDSPHAVNLQACIENAAFEVLQTHVSQGGNSNSIIRHNLAVSSGGDRALQAFSSFAEQNDEAKLNLALCYIKCGEIEAAVELLEGVDAKSLHSHNVLAVLTTEVAQRNGDERALEEAKRHFNTCGNSKAGDTFLVEATNLRDDSDSLV